MHRHKHPPHQRPPVESHRNCIRKTNSPSRPRSPRSPLTTTHYHLHIQKHGEADSDSQCSGMCSPGPFLSTHGLQHQRAHGLVKPIMSTSKSPKWESPTANTSKQLLVTLKVHYIQKRSNQRLKGLPLSDPVEPLTSLGIRFLLEPLVTLLLHHVSH